jgi:hypothetical protein
MNNWFQWIYFSFSLTFHLPIVIWLFLFRSFSFSAFSSCHYYDLWKSVIQCDRLFLRTDKWGKKVEKLPKFTIIIITMLMLLIINDVKWRDLHAKWKERNKLCFSKIKWNYLLGNKGRWFPNKKKRFSPDDDEIDDKLSVLLQMGSGRKRKHIFFGRRINFQDASNAIVIDEDYITHQTIYQPFKNRCLKFSLKCFYFARSLLLVALYNIFSTNVCIYVYWSLIAINSSHTNTKQRLFFYYLFSSLL